MWCFVVAHYRTSGLSAITTQPLTANPHTQASTGSGPAVLPVSLPATTGPGQRLKSCLKDRQPPVDDAAFARHHLEGVRIDSAGPAEVIVSRKEAAEMTSAVRHASTGVSPYHPLVSHMNATRMFHRTAAIFKACVMQHLMYSDPLSCSHFLQPTAQNFTR